MPDISLCATQHCPLADNCYRKTAVPDYRQSYMAFHYRIESEMRGSHAVLVAYCDRQIKLNHKKQDVTDEQL
jgi:hypothetical protein